MSERSLVTLSQLGVCGPIMVMNVRVAVTIMENHRAWWGSGGSLITVDAAEAWRGSSEVLRVHAHLHLRFFRATSDPNQ